MYVWQSLCIRPVKVTNARPCGVVISLIQEYRSEVSGICNSRVVFVMEGGHVIWLLDKSTEGRLTPSSSNLVLCPHWARHIKTDVLKSLQKSQESFHYFTSICCNHGEYIPKYLMFCWPIYFLKVISQKGTKNYLYYNHNNKTQTLSSCTSAVKTNFL